MRKKDFEDDGRTVADMSSTYKKSWYERFDEASKKNTKPEKEQPKLMMTKKETGGLILNAIFAALAIGLVFAGVVFLFLLFCTKVWLA